MRQEHRRPVLGSQAQPATEVRGCLKDPGRGPGLWPLLQAPPPPLDVAETFLPAALLLTPLPSLTEAPWTP